MAILQKQLLFCSTMKISWIRRCSRNGYGHVMLIFSLSKIFLSSIIEYSYMYL